MLVLSRRVNEEIIVDIGGRTATITVVSVRGDKVRLGVTAPREVAVRRGEVSPLAELVKPDPDALTACG